MTLQPHRISILNKGVDNVRQPLNHRGLNKISVQPKLYCCIFNQCESASKFQINILYDEQKLII